MKFSLKKLLVLGLGLAIAGLAFVAVVLISLASNLPNLITVEDYEPLLVSEVYARGGEKIGQFFREKRTLVNYEEIPEDVVHAFVAAEDAQFFEHHGINITSIFRAIIANIRAGRKVQGASTITQQVARSLLLTPEKSYVRKIREMILAYRMESHMSKEDIMYLYLNQIYFGQGAYGISTAAETYFRKPLAQLQLEEIAILAGLPQAPSRYSPVHNPKDAKRRQLYVLARMADDDFISQEQAEEAGQRHVTVYKRQNFKEIAPYYLETVRQLLVSELGEKKVLDEGLQIYTGLDFEQQIEANKQLQEGLRGLDKRQGYRGPSGNLQDPEQIAQFLLKTRDELIEGQSPERVILPDGTNPEKPDLSLPEFPEMIAQRLLEEQQAAAAAAAETTESESTSEQKQEEVTSAQELDKENFASPIPFYLKQGDIVKAVVISMDDEWGLVKVRFAEGIGLIDFSTMKWARKPNAEKYFLYDEIKKPSDALQKGDLIDIRIRGKKFYSTAIEDRLLKQRREQKELYERPSELPLFEYWAEVELEQDPQAEAALISFDQQSSEILAMVGGYDFARSEFNRTIQSARQTGSAFKAIVYAAAMDKSYTPATPIVDAPIVYEEEIESEGAEEDDEKTIRRWKPTNHSKKFGGDILFRNALIKSLNVPTVKILQDVGVDWVADYAKRLGIFSPLNMDFTLGLGSSSLTLYEATKVFAQFGRLGRRIRPLLIHQVLSRSDDILLEKVSLDRRFTQEITALDEEFEQRRQEHFEMKALEEQEKRIAEAERQFAEQEAALNAESTENSEDSQSVTEAQNLEEELPEVPRDPLIFHRDPDQLIRPQTAYLITSLLQGAVVEGTGKRAQALNRPLAAKTGTTNGYFDGWFIGYTPQVVSGVWVGYDQERSLGKLEVGGRNALPIWLGYMQKAHEGLPARSFPVPSDIIFANIDNDTGRLASVNTKNYVRQAFIDGTEPKESTDSLETFDEEETNFYKEDLSE